MQPIQRQSDFYAFTDESVAQRAAAYEEPSVPYQLAFDLGLTQAPGIPRGALNTRIAQDDGTDLAAPPDQADLSYEDTQPAIDQMAPRADTAPTQTAAR